MRGTVLQRLLSMIFPQSGSTLGKPREYVSYKIIISLYEANVNGDNYLLLLSCG
jgi:hypothetical protein